MKRLIFPIFLLAGLAFGLGVVLSTPTPPAHSVDISITSIVSNGYPRVYACHGIGDTNVEYRFVLAAIESSNGWSRLCNVVVSNSSAYPITAYGGGGSLRFQIKYLSNDVWLEYGTGSIDGGPGFWPAHWVIASNSFEIPDSASALNIGLTYTSCTWRSSLAWRRLMSTWLGGYLFRLDFKNRTRTEWSGEYVIRSNLFFTRAPIGTTP